jgi:hypothetical protein
MRAFVLLLALPAACGGSPETPQPKVDAGHDVAEEAMDDSGTPVLDTGSPLEAATKCEALTFDHDPIVLSDPKNDGDRVVAGLDIDGDGKGITIPEVEAQICAGNPGGGGAGGTRVETWGASRELRLDYEPTTLLVEGVGLFPGYLGVMTLPTDPSGPDAGHTFTVGLGQVLLDGAPFAIEWTGTMRSAENELYNAISYNAACYPGYDPTPCETNGNCAVATVGSERQFSIPTIGVTLGFSLEGTEAEQSSVVEIDLLPL